MDKFDQLREKGRRWTEAEYLASLASLTASPYFPALIRMMDESKENASDQASDLTFADKPGSLAHAAGMRFGYRVIETKFRQLIKPPKRRGRAEQPAEE